MMESELLKHIAEGIAREILERDLSPQKYRAIPVGVSSRHIHLSAEHMEILFGCGHQLNKMKDLSQVGEFAAQETVTLVGPKGVLPHVRILGPIRKRTQLEISLTDGYILGIKPPVRDSGQLLGTPGLVVAGPAGGLNLQEGVICAGRHLHVNQQEATDLGVADGQRVAVEIGGVRGGSLGNILVRVHDNFRLELHIDTDEANAFCLKSGDTVILQKVREVDTRGV